MNAKNVLGVSLAGLFVLFAMHGVGFFTSAEAGLLFADKMLEGAPLGLWSFLLALGLGVASRPFLLKWTPELECPVSRDLLIDVAAVAIGIGVMWGQLRTLNGLLLGCLAGFTAPYLYKAGHALIAVAWKRIQGVRRVQP